QVPTDGLLISGYSLSIDESSSSYESEQIQVSRKKPFLLSGINIQDGSAKMLVTAVGMRTEWGSLMTTLYDGDEEERPLQKLMNDRVLVRHLLAYETMGFASCICTDKTVWHWIHFCNRVSQHGFQSGYRRDRGEAEGSAPLTSVQLIWVNMIMDTLGALALATEPPNNELMKRPPVG
uniref:Uncharacterized protein n=1 Tax=Chenopodium quinoa TaxID=63459 RepID=A0A803MJG1_CHEQI